MIMFKGAASHLASRIVSRASWNRIASLCLLLLGLMQTEAKAVLVIGSQGQNVGAPTDPGQNAAFQFQGVWQTGFLGTAVAPNFFVTAKHLGGNIGDTFTYQGASYQTTAAYDDPNSTDLRLWQVSGQFNSYASLYQGSSELNQQLVAFGMGGPKGAVVNVNGIDRGWEYTSPGNVITYGTNQVDYAGTFPDAGNSQYLAFKFDATRGSNTASLSPGDSGGGIFIQEDGIWKLAGVNYAVDGTFYTKPPSDPTRESSAIFGALYDTRGLYAGDNPNPIPNGPDPFPTASYVSRISTEAAWINGITGVPEPSSLILLGLGTVGFGIWTVRRSKQPKTNKDAFRSSYAE